MRETLAHRTLIIGNGGSGKSTLAARIAERLQMPLIGLDAIHWEDGCFARKRDEDATRQMVRDAAAANRWVMEASMAGCLSRRCRAPRRWSGSTCHGRNAAPACWPARPPSRWMRRA